MLTILVPGASPQNNRRGLMPAADVKRACAGRIQEDASRGQWWCEDCRGPSTTQTLAPCASTCSAQDDRVGRCELNLAESGR
jgi:hypothetical protein